jgi:hypothetical protein
MFGINSRTETTLTNTNLESRIWLEGMELSYMGPPGAPQLGEARQEVAFALAG